LNILQEFTGRNSLFSCLDLWFSYEKGLTLSLMSGKKSVILLTGQILT